MGLDVIGMTQNGHMENAECIICGVCADACPKEAIQFEL
jgi:formate hydrogenlyase subunit 6/NADH:ubiquinone oxidoreductase subunit I